jgi:proteasome lid subunit RPN8/RPN11
MRTPFTLAAVERVLVHRSVVEAVHGHLRDAGTYGYEAVAFWAGEITNARTAVANTAFVPRQFSARSDSGLSVSISGEDLFRMNVRLHENNLQLIAQIHSHPGSAYHSETDDDLAVMTQLGGLSIVVPDFAQGDFQLERVAIYRRADDGWMELAPVQVSNLIEIVED